MWAWTVYPVRAVGPWATLAREAVAVPESLEVSQILGYAGYLQSVFILTCDRKSKIQPIGKVETMTKMKVIKWMNH
ncbi:hypothetical protein HGM15179_020908 [Zosterops borbonicus]|uniref:Uncharacterized protein n=1 Tax=Zosterops borbonicus TaxID=364589 RepID=A0A8K1D8U3_9PASS|nr:hypothetical protein HGM15179_020908 [Zosterops borbonicus]